MKMSKIFRSVVIILTGMGALNSVKAQGCSDAGVCSFEAHSGDEQKKSTIGFMGGVGMADGGVIVNTVALSAKYQLSDDLSIMGMLPMVNTFGQGYAVSGIGDPFIGLNISLFEEESSKMDILLGGRIAIGATDATDNDNPAVNLPMPFQPGLGTNDALIRATYSYDVWTFALGFQQPFGETENNYSVGDLDIEDEADKFYSSKFMKRAADVSFRVDYAFKGEETIYRVGVLPIFRLANSTILEQVVGGGGGNNPDQFIYIEKEVANSSGLTFNITGGLATELSTDWMFRADVGFPVLVRENRPDGLTRSFQLNAGIDFLF